MNTYLSVIAAMVLLLPGAAQAQSITKCQDADGNWHYGDFAAEACAEESTITEIDERGQTLRETEAPPSRDELEAEEAARQAAEQQAELEAREREANQRLLRTYESVEGIMQSRDARVAGIDNDLESHRLFRQDLIDERKRLLEENGDPDRIRDIEERIQEYDEAIEALEADRRDTMEKFNEDAERFRELTGD